MLQKVLPAALEVKVRSRRTRALPMLTVQIDREKSFPRDYRVLPVSLGDGGRSPTSAPACGGREAGTRYSSE